MKKLIFILCLTSLFAFKSSDNPLNNTKWRGVLLAPDPVDAIFDYQDDICYVHVGGKVIESTSYQISGDTIRYKKISGTSPCGSSQTGKYLFSIKDHVLKFKLIEDDCEARSASLTEGGYEKMD